MSPGWAGRSLIGLFLAGFAGLPVFPPIAGWRFSAEAQETADIAKPIEPAAAGHTPGGAFFIDLRDGFDPKTQYISHFDIDSDTTLVVLRQENVTFDADGMTLTARRSSEEGRPYSMAE